MATLGLKNVNMLSKEQYDTIAEPVKDELWTVEVETYSDDDGNWYRVYPDGWCEQGGNASAAGTITLLKPYRDNKYIKSISPQSTTHTYTGNTTTTSFTITGGGANWTAKGYIA